MGEIIKERTNKVRKIGNSLGFLVKNSFLEMAGMDKDQTKVKEAVIYGKHGIFIGHWIPENQPTAEELPEEKLEKLDLNLDKEK